MKISKFKAGFLALVIIFSAYGCSRVSPRVIALRHQRFADLQPRIARVALMPLTCTIWQTAEDGASRELLPAESVAAVERFQEFFKGALRAKDYTVTDLGLSPRLDKARRKIPRHPLDNYRVGQLYEADAQLLRAIEDCYSGLEVINAKFVQDKRKSYSFVIDYEIAAQVARLPGEVRQADALLFAHVSAGYERKGEVAERWVTDVGKSCLYTVATLGFIIFIPSTTPQDYYNLALFLVDAEDGKLLWANNQLDIPEDITSESNVKAAVEKVLKGLPPAGKIEGKR